VLHRRARFARYLLLHPAVCHQRKPIGRTGGPVDSRRNRKVANSANPGQVRRDVKISAKSICNGSALRFALICMPALADGPQNQSSTFSNAFANPLADQLRTFCASQINGGRNSRSSKRSAENTSPFTLLRAKPSSRVRPSISSTVLGIFRSKIHNGRHQGERYWRRRPPFPEVIDARTPLLSMGQRESIISAPNAFQLLHTAP